MKKVRLVNGVKTPIERTLDYGTNRRHRRHHRRRR